MCHCVLRLSNDGMGARKLAFFKRKKHNSGQLDLTNLLQGRGASWIFWLIKRVTYSRGGAVGRIRSMRVLFCYVLSFCLANLNRGKFHRHLRDMFAPLVIRYIDLMESSIAQSLHKGFQKENWTPLRLEPWQFWTCAKFFVNSNLIYSVSFFVERGAVPRRTCSGSWLYCNSSLRN